VQLIDGSPVYSATDLVGFLACEHLTDLELTAIEGFTARPERTDPELDVVRKRGFAHEQRYLAHLAAQGRQITTIAPDTSGETPDGSRVTRGERLARQVAETLAAIRRGDDVIYQAAFLHGPWLGYADFLLRIDEPSALGAYRYEITDTKLAHEVRASALLQLCTYADLLGTVQGTPPAFVEVALGGSEGQVERHRVADYAAYYRALKERFEARVVAGVGAYPPPDSYPDPVDHCAVCRWWLVCDARRRRDDDLSLVAGLTRNQRRRLPEAGVRTRRDLAAWPVPVPRVAGSSRESLTRVREQARLQVSGEEAGRVLSELLAPERTEEGTLVPDRGLATLPPPSPGDLFLDFEGDPFALDDGLEYLVGLLEPGRELIRAQPTLGLLMTEQAPPAYAARWALDRAEEKRAFQWLIDTIMDRRARDPYLHVYHYGSYERGRVARLSTRHATREEEVDILLRDGVFVDLYRAVKQGIRASTEGYSIKDLEPLYQFVREAELRKAGKSIVEFERYLEEGRRDQSILDTIEAYNRDDVVSTWRLRDWLEERRLEAIRRFGPLPRPGTVVAESVELSADRLRVKGVSDTLTAGLPPEADRSPADRAIQLLANLLDWHWREEKTIFWRFYELMAMDPDELADQPEPIAALRFDSTRPVGGRSAQMLDRYLFDPQDNDVERGAELFDPSREGADAWTKKVGTVEAIDQSAGVLEIKRSGGAGRERPGIVVPYRRFGTDRHRDALLEIGAWVADHGIEGPGPYRAARVLLLRATPRVGQPGGGLRRSATEPIGPPIVPPGADAQDVAVEVATRLDATTLAIQGPPGSGKTTTGATMILRCVSAGKRVGITALGHKVIGNLLEEVCRQAGESGAHLAAVQRAEDDRAVDHDAVKIASSNDDVRAALDAGTATIAAGTSWLWTHPVMRGAVDVLFVDEAGQMSLANVVAMAPATASIVLLGDPQQLEQPMHGAHPDGAEASALDHVLAGRQTIEPDRGIFLEHTWRLHPSICAFTSDVFYEDRLRSQPSLERQRIAGSGPVTGSGLRWVGVPGEGRRNASPEEVEAVTGLVSHLTGPGMTWVDAKDVAHPMTLKDVLVVAPYNAQVAALKQALPVGARVGTVDKFQGQQAPVVVYSMTTSDPRDAPHGMEFLYSLNRLNVATSRARALAIVVLSPELLRPDVHTPRQLRLANALCRYLELAQPLELADVEPQFAWTL
jgi:uncharacterized protein